MDELARLEIKAESGSLVTADKRLEQLEKQGKKTDKTVGGLGSTLKSFAGTAAIVTAATAAMWSAFGNVRSAEKLDAMLKTATGSAIEARIAMGELSSWAKDMPNTLEDVTNSFIKLENLGLASSQQAMMSYGDTAASMGKQLNDMIEAVADAATGEFERLKEFGIKASSEGNKVAFTFRGVTTTVGKNAKEIEDYLIQLGETNFGGSMAAQMDTIDGKLSNLSDSWFQFTVALSESSKAGGLFRKLLDVPIETFDQLTASIKGLDVDVKTAGIEDITTLKSMLAATYKEMQGLNQSSSVFSGADLTSDLANQANLIRSRIEELELKKRMKKDAEDFIELQSKQVEGYDALLRIEEKRYELGLSEGEQLDRKRIKNLEEIDMLTQQIAEGEFANLTVVEKRVLKLEEENQKLEAKRGKLVIDAQNEVGGFFSDGNTELEDLISKQESERAYIFAHKDLLFENEKQYEEKLTELKREHERERELIKTSSFDRVLGKSSEFFGGLERLSGSHNAKLAKIGKAAAIVNTTIATYQSATDAYKAMAGIPYVGPALGAAAAAAAIAAGMENVASIKSENFVGNYNSGGVIPGNSFYGDRLTAGVNSGEVILDFPKQKRLLDIADGKKKSGSDSGYGWTINVHNYGNSKVTSRVNEQSKTIDFMIEDLERGLASRVRAGSSEIAEAFDQTRGTRRIGV